MYECTNCGLLFDGRPFGSLGFPYCERCFRKVWKNNYRKYYNWLRKAYTIPTTYYEKKRS